MAGGPTAAVTLFRAMAGLKENDASSAQRAARQFRVGSGAAGYHRSSEDNLYDAQCKMRSSTEQIDVQNAVSWFTSFTSTPSVGPGGGSPLSSMTRVPGIQMLS